MGYKVSLSQCFTQTIPQEIPQEHFFKKGKAFRVNLSQLTPMCLGYKLLAAKYYISYY